MSKTLKIEKVNFDLLNKQRLALIDVLMLDDHGIIDDKAEDSLQGLLNMLDYWYDTQYSPIKEPR